MISHAHNFNVLLLLTYKTIILLPCLGNAKRVYILLTISDWVTTSAILTFSTAGVYLNRGSSLRMEWNVEDGGGS